MTSLLGLLPMWLRRTVAYGVAVLVVAGVVYVLSTVVSLLTSLVLAVAAALLLAAMLMPLVELLHRVRVPRGLAALVAVLLLLGVVGGVVALVGNGLAREAENLANSIGEGVQRLRDYATNGPLKLKPDQLDRIGEEASNRLRETASGSLTGAAVVLEGLGAVALALVLLFFLLKDGPRMAAWLLSRTPEHNRDRTDRAARSGWHTLKAYVRGTATIAAIDAIGIGLGLWLLDVPLALPLALLTFVFAFVPIIGAVAAGSIAVLVALAANGPVNALLVLGLVLLVQNLEGNLLEPVIMGRAVRLHPAVVLLAVAAGALLGGVGGALLATPIAAVAYRVVHTFRAAPETEPAPEAKAATDSAG